jgi:multicomponent Na+:H+ antiporter subunit D
VAVLGDRLGKPLLRRTEQLWTIASGPLRPEGRVAAPWSTHLMVWWLALLLGLVLLLALM